MYTSPNRFQSYISRYFCFGGAKAYVRGGRRHEHDQAAAGRQKPTWTASPEDSLSSTVFGNEDDLRIGELLDFPLLIL